MERSVGTIVIYPELITMIPSTLPKAFVCVPSPDTRKEESGDDHPTKDEI